MEVKNNGAITTPYYRNGNKKNPVHTCFQGPDGLFQFADLRLSEEQLNKLIALMVSHRWILISIE